MNKIIFTEEFCQPEKLHPFTLTRQLQDIRVGILTIREKWEKMFGLTSYDKKEDDYKDLSRAVDVEKVVAGRSHAGPRRGADLVFAAQIIPGKQAGVGAGKILQFRVGLHLSGVAAVQGGQEDLFAQSAGG